MRASRDCFLALIIFYSQAAQLESRTSIATPQESMQNALDRAPSRASVDSVRSHAFSDRSGLPIQPNGISLLSVTAPVPSHPHVAPKGISASPKRDSLPFASSPHLPQSVKPVLPRTSSASGVATTAQLVDVRARKRVAGREKKLMGDMWLLSGRPQEAITAFVQHLSQLSFLFRTHDHASSAASTRRFCSRRRGPIKFGRRALTKDSRSRSSSRRCNLGDRRQL